MIGQWARLFTQLTTFRTMTCFGESNGSTVLVTTRSQESCGGRFGSGHCEVRADMATLKIYTNLRLAFAKC